MQKVQQRILDNRISIQLRALLVEDSEDDARHVLRLLKDGGYAVTHERVDSLEGMRAALDRHAWDIVICDFRMPGFDGRAALALLRERNADLPFIVVSGTIGEDTAVAMMKAGASDYVMKGNLLRLVPAVQRELRDAEARRKHRQGEEALRTSEAEFHTLAESMPQMVWITRPDGWNIYFSHRWMDYTGLTLEESLGEGWTKPFHPDEQQRARNAWQQATATGSIYSIESRLRRADGVYRWWLIRGVPLQDATGNILKWFGTCTDIHDLKEAELEVSRANLSLRKSEVRIKYMNRVYAVLSGINTLIVRARDRSELFREACRIAVDQGGFTMCLIGMVDTGSMKIVPVASAGMNEELISTIKALSTGEDASGTMMARAISHRQPIIANDSNNDPRALLRKWHGEAGVRSLAVLPLIVSNEAVGVLVLYAGEIEFFHEEEMKLLKELASDIAFAIDHIEKQERLNYLAYYDVLTGLANRTLFLERVGQKLIAAGNSKRKLSVLALDVERFKSINDALGRQAGDDLLKQIADRFRKASRDDSRLARVGADHFAIVDSDAQTEEEIGRLTELRLKKCFDPPFHIGDSDIHVSARAGIAMFPRDGRNAETLLRNAEAAHKKAKASGEHYVFYAEEMTARVAEQLALENKLRQALEKEEFVLHYQPKIDLETRRIVGVEALIRWQSPDLGLVPPMQFIPLMERTGQILEVGAWALSKAVKDHLQWTQMRLPAPRIAVNVSAIQLRNKDFVGMVERAISQGASPPGIDLEITESLIMDDIESNIGKLKEVCALGVGIAIDDFGTGYSSLAYLAKLPVQTLKIDRSFVITMLEDGDTMTLVQTIISMAHSLRLRVVAEGVDAEAQAKMLRLLRCDEMQGFLFSKAVPFDALTAMLRKAESEATKPGASSRPL